MKDEFPVFNDEDYLSALRSIHEGNRAIFESIKDLDFSLRNKIDEIDSTLETIKTTTFSVVL